MAVSVTGRYTKLQKLTARFAPADIGADLTALPKNERDALARLVDAARIMDALFLRQVWAGNDAMLMDLAQKAAMPVGRPAASCIGNTVNSTEMRVPSWRIAGTASRSPAP